MKEFLEYMLKNIVDAADAVVVTEVYATNVLVFEIKVAKPDMGKIIGKKGATIMAIRTIMHVLAAKFNMRVTLHIIEAEGA